MILYLKPIYKGIKLFGYLQCAHAVCDCLDVVGPLVFFMVKAPCDQIESEADFVIQEMRLSFNHCKP